MNRLAHRRDLWLLFAALTLAAAFWLLWPRPQSGGTAVVKKGEELLFTIDLHADVGRRYELAGDYPLVVEVHAQGVCVKEASCPDKLCERMGMVQSGMIVCLPARVLVEIQDGGGDGIDVVAG